MLLSMQHVHVHVCYIVHNMYIHTYVHRTRVHVYTCCAVSSKSFFLSVALKASIVFKTMMEPGPGQAYGGWTGGLQGMQFLIADYIIMMSYRSNPLYSRRKLVGRPGTESMRESIT